MARANRRDESFRYMKLSPFLGVESVVAANPVALGNDAVHRLTAVSGAPIEYDMTFKCSPDDADLSYDPGGPGWASTRAMTVRPSRRQSRGRRRSFLGTKTLKHAASSGDPLPRQGTLNVALEAVGGLTGPHADDFQHEIDLC